MFGGGRRENKVSDKLEGGIKLGVDNLRPDLRRLQTGTGSFARAQRLKSLVQRSCILLLRSLKKHIFKQMCKALLVLWLVDYRRIKLKSKCNRTQTRHILADQFNAIGQAMIKIVRGQIELLIHVYRNIPF